MTTKREKKFDLQLHLEDLRLQFLRVANKSKATAMSAYMKNKFQFMGLPKPIRDTIVKPWLKILSGIRWEEQKIASSWLWKQDEREFQYVAMELLFKNKKLWTEESLTHFEKLLISKSWWDTVDYIAAALVGAYFEIFSETKQAKINEWINSNNMWLNRTAILFQLKYKNKTDIKLLFKSILPNIQSNEFFIQKAIGWALRQYAYTDPDMVKKFISSNELKPLSKREALKHLKKL